MNDKIVITITITWANDKDIINRIHSLLGIKLTKRIRKTNEMEQ